jgi:hypothetical protein
VALARAADGCIEFVPQVGDFLAVDEPTVRLHGGAARIDDQRLRAVGRARQRADDGAGPDLRLRILVDIAIKALSAAINDPTTAVMAIDQLHRMLRVVGPAPPAQRRPARRDQQRAPDLRHAEVGGLRAPDLHRDPPLRRPQRAGDAAHALDAGDTCFSPCPSIAMPSCAASSTCSTGRSTSSYRLRRGPGAGAEFPIRRASAERWAEAAAVGTARRAGPDLRAQLGV